MAAAVRVYQLQNLIQEQTGLDQTGKKSFVLQEMVYQAITLMPLTCYRCSLLNSKTVISANMYYYS